MLGNMEQDIFGEDQSTGVKTDRLVRVISDLPINWVGNKKRMLHRLIEFMNDNHVEGNTVFDAFAGSGVVSMMFAASGKKVVSNDLLTLSTTWLLATVTGKPNPLTQEDYRALTETFNDQEPPSKVAFLGNLYDGLILTPDEVIRLDSFRRGVAHLFGKQMSIGHRLDGNVLRPAYMSLDDSSVSFESGSGNPDKVSFAMQMMCVHILQQAFMGGRCYKSQLLAIHDKRMKEGKTQQNGSNTAAIGYAEKLFPLLKPATCPVNGIYELLSAKNADVVVTNCETETLISSGAVQADIAYFDPPYGGYNSDYAWMYRVCEEFLTGVLLEDNRGLREAAVKFKGNDYERDKAFGKEPRKGYEENFEALLEASSDFPTWVISFNESSFVPIEDIIGIISKFRPVSIVETAGGYKYNYREKTEKHGSEYIILAKNG